MLALDMPAEGFLPEGVKVVLADLDKCSDAEVRQMLAPCDAVVFAIGKDDRFTRSRPAYEFFRKANVEPTVRIVRLAPESGVGRVALCSSMFAYFDRIWPDLELSRFHPYIRVRREQEEASEVRRIAVAAVERPRRYQCDGGAACGRSDRRRARAQIPRPGIGGR